MSGYHLLSKYNKIIIYFYPYVDEEIGGGTGMNQFVKTDDFKAMNLGFALDEGMHGWFYFCIACIRQQYD